MTNESEFEELDCYEQDDFVENDGWTEACKCGCGNHLNTFSEWKDNNGYIYGHEESKWTLIKKNKKQIRSMRSLD